MRQFVTYIKKKIDDLDSNIQSLALDILDYCVDYSKLSFHTQIGSKDFLSRLINVIKTRNNPEVRMKILYLFKKWAFKFEDNKDIIPNFNVFYSNLIKNGFAFPVEYR